MSINARPFEFKNEFTPSGEVLNGEKPSFVRVDEMEQRVNQARAEGEAAAMASLESQILQSLQMIAGTLTPVEQVVGRIATSLRNDAIDLALVSSKQIAGKALEEFGADHAAEAIAAAAKQLRDVPEILVLAAPDIAQGASMRLENLPGMNAKIRFHPDPAARPGDWRIEFSQGAVAHSAEAVEQAVEKALNQRKEDPVEDQLDLFGGAAA